MKIQNRRGSALTMVMVLAGILSIVLTAGLTVANRMQGETKSLASKLETAKLANYIQANLENPAICFGLGAASGSPLQGLQFYTPGLVQDDLGDQTPNQLQFDTSLVTNTDKKAQQMIALSSTLKEGLIRNGAILSQYGLTVRRFYISNVNQPAGTTNPQADVWVQFSDGKTIYKEQRLGTIYLTANAAGKLLSCQMQMSAKDVCESMNCTWNETAPLGADPLTYAKCACNIPDLSCPGVDNGYVHGYDPIHQVAICKSASYSCTDPGTFFSGFDNNGAPICTVAYGTTASTAPSAPSPTSSTLPSGPQPTCTRWMHREYCQYEQDPNPCMQRSDYMSVAVTNVSDASQCPSGITGGPTGGYSTIDSTGQYWFIDESSVVGQVSWTEGITYCPSGHYFNFSAGNCN